MTNGITSVFVIKRILLCLLTCSVGVIQAQTIDYKILDSKNGLSDDFVYAIHEDAAGALWIGTSTGLNRYNGREVDLFKTEDGLQNNFVSAIASEDQNPSLWIGHFNGGVSRFDQSGFRSLAVQLDQPIEHIVGSAQVGYWAVSRSGEILMLSDSIHSQIDPVDLGIQNASAVGLLDDKLLVIGGSHGIRILDLESQLLVDFPNDFEQVVSIEEHQANGLIIIDQTGVQRLISQKNGISTQAITDVSTSINSSTVACSKEGHIWVSNGSTLQLFTLDSSRNSGSLTRRFETENGLATSNIELLFEDSEGHLWIANRGSGLRQIKFPVAMFYSKEQFPALQGLNACVELEPFRYLIGGESGLYSMRLDDRTLEVLEIAQILDDHVTAISTSNNEYAWVGTVVGDLVKIESNVETSRIQASVPDKINHVSVDREGHIWAAFTTIGALQLDLDGNFLQSYNTSTGLSHNNIRSIFHDSRGGHWFSLYGSKMSYLSRGVFSYYGKEEGLNSFDFTGVAEDKSGTIWVATSDAGAFQFESDSFAPADFGDEWISARIQELFILENDQLVAITSDGVYRCSAESAKEGVYRSFSQLQKTTIVANGMSVNGSGSGLLPTSEGLFRIPIDDRIQKVLPNTTLLEVDIDGSLNPKSGSSFSSSTKRYHFTFDAVDLTNDRPVYFWYMLNGYDDDWIGPTSSPFADYTNLDPGEYNFLLKAGHNIHNLSPEADLYHLTILPPFWRSWWFVTLATLVFFLLTYGIIVLRTKQLEQANKALELVVAERTEQLRAQNRDIRQFAYTVSHDLKAPANNIIALLTMVKAQDLVKKEGGELIKMLEDTGQHMRSNLERLMELVKSYERVSSQSTSIDLEKLIQEIQTNIHSLLIESNAVLKLQLQVKSINYNRSDLTSILHNLITNAIKYRDPKRPLVVEVGSSASKDYFVLSVKDNGLGINMAEDGHKLFQQFQRIHTNAEGSGVGLSLMKKMIEKRGGKIEVESASGVGSVFSVYLKTKD